MRECVCVSLCSGLFACSSFVMRGLMSGCCCQFNYVFDMLPRAVIGQLSFVREMCLQQSNPELPNFCDILRPIW